MIKKAKFHKDTFDNTTEERRKKVLDVAIEEFASKGYNATSINEIARNANISIGAMYSYFASKEDLFLTIVNNSYYLMDSILKEIAANSSDVFDCIERMLKTSREFALKNPQLNQIYLDLTTQALSNLSVRLSNKLEIITPHLLSDIINQAKRQGKIAEDMDEKVIAYCIDNIFMMYQFSFSSDYYKERLRIYIGEEKLNDIDHVEKVINQFIRSAIEKK